MKKINLMNNFKKNNKQFNQNKIIFNKQKLNNNKILKYKAKYSSLKNK